MLLQPIQFYEKLACLLMLAKEPHFRYFSLCHQIIRILIYIYSLWLLRHKRPGKWLIKIMDENIFIWATLTTALWHIPPFCFWLPPLLLLFFWVLWVASKHNWRTTAPIGCYCMALKKCSWIRTIIERACDAYCWGDKINKCNKYILAVFK